MRLKYIGIQFIAIIIEATLLLHSMPPMKTCMIQIVTTVAVNIIVYLMSDSQPLAKIDKGELQVKYDLI